jgi:hypothetical protein
VIAFTWMQRSTEPDGSVVDHDEGEVRFELAERGDKVLLTLLHSRQPTETLAGHSAGWHAYLDNLDARISGRGGIDFMDAVRRVRHAYEERIASLHQSGAA